MTNSAVPSPVHIVFSKASAPSKRSLPGRGLAKVLALPLLLGGLLAISGCDESDASSLRVALNEKSGGTITASSVVLPAEPGPARRTSAGVNWTHQAGVVMNTGTFEDVSTLRVADIAFARVGGKAVGGATGGEGAVVIEATLPRGTDAKWPGVLSVTDAAQRESAANAMSTLAPKVGSVVKIIVEVPKGYTIVTAGLIGRGKGLNSSFEQSSATLLVPMDVAVTAAPDLRWTITYAKDAPDKK